MANQITEVPASVSSAGHSFNYAAWTANTVVTLVTVPWDSDYRNIVSKSSNIDSWIDSRTDKLVVANMRHMRLDQPIRLDAPFEVASQYNYVRATNPAQPVQGSLPSTYYYFIKAVSYGSANNTILDVQLDVWATFRNNVELGRAYVERGHIGVANGFRNNRGGGDYLTVPEGLDLGGEMSILHTYEHQIASAVGTGDSIDYSILVVSKTDLSKDPGDVDNAKINTATGSKFENLPHGASIYIFKTVDAFHGFMSAYSDKSWVSQAIISITAIPTWDELGIQFGNVTIPDMPSEYNGEVVRPLPGTIPNKNVNLTTDWRKDAPLPERYSFLDKLNTYPYTALETTTYTGTPIVYKPESVGNWALQLKQLTHLAPGGMRVMFIPSNYNAGPDANAELPRWDGGEWLDIATGIFNFPMFSVVNDSFNGYMASNRNTISFQHQSAAWDQQRAMMGANTAFGQAGSGMDLTQAMNAATQSQIGSNMGLQNLTRGRQGQVQVVDAGVGAAGQVLSGNILGGAINGVRGMGVAAANTLIDQDHNTRSAAIQGAYATQTTQAQLNNQSYMADTNLSYARGAAQGDYANAIAGIQAKVQDNKMLQPTTSGQVGGESFNLAKMGWSLFVKVKRIRGTALAEVAEFWLRYGYRVNRWIDLPEDLLVMSKMSYWKVIDSHVFAHGCPEEYRMTIRGILEKGVTVWKNIDEIGRIDPATNTPLDGISY